jgi:outer membrane protein OmpA-like peptidoglycan-associated protein
LPLALSGCSTQTAEDELINADGSTHQTTAAGTADNAVEDTRPLSVIMVVGAHANAPQVSSYPQLDKLLTQACETRGYVAIVTVEGTPQIFDGAGAIVGSDAPTTRIRDEENASWIAGLNELATTQAKATSPEVDTLEALRLANRALSSAPAGRHRIVVVDSGLSTTGVLDFTLKDMLYVMPADVATYLASIEALVPFDPNTQIEWYGLGDAAAPQDALTNYQRANLKEIWTAVINASGAQVNFHDDPPAGNAASGLPSVSIIDIEPEPQPQVINTSEPVFLNEGMLHFIADTASFIEPNEAYALLEPYAQQLIQNPNLQVHVIGTTAECDADYAYALSTDRANAVRDLLIDLGAPAEQLVAEGQGWFNQWHLPEIDEYGVYHPELAAQNRKVVLVRGDDPHGCTATSS